MIQSLLSCSVFWTHIKRRQAAAFQKSRTRNPYESDMRPRPDSNSLLACIAPRFRYAVLVGPWSAGSGDLVFPSARILRQDRFWRFGADLKKVEILKYED